MTGNSVWSIDKEKHKEKIPAFKLSIMFIHVVSNGNTVVYLIVITFIGKMIKSFFLLNTRFLLLDGFAAAGRLRLSRPENKPLSSIVWGADVIRARF